jgi:hypothetical protein
MTKAEIERLASAIAEKIGGNCQCNLDPEQQKEMGHFFGMLKDENGGNTGQGVETLRRMIQADHKARKAADIIAKAFLVLLTTSFVAALGRALWVGIKKGISP